MLNLSSSGPRYSRCRGLEKSIELNRYNKKAEDSMLQEFKKFAMRNVIDLNRCDYRRRFWKNYDIPGMI